MSTETLRKCDECGEPIAAGSRWFRLSAELHGVNGEAKVARVTGRSDAALDCCSARCIHIVVGNLIAEVSAPTPNN